MNAIEISAPPDSLFSLQLVTGTHDEWVSLALCFEDEPGKSVATIAQIFKEMSLHDALATFSCLISLSDPAWLTDNLAKVLPAEQIIWCVSAANCTDPVWQEGLLLLQQQGFRIFMDGLPGAVAVKGVDTLALDCGAGVSPGIAACLHKLAGPHLARNVHTRTRFNECLSAGFRWFSGDYPLQLSARLQSDAGPSRTRLLKLLGLLARDAESRDLEALLKQDTALSYNLIKLVSSAAFAQTKSISSFSQAINLLGRRQLQRWLQLLLYAHQHEGAAANPLLPHAALRASMMEALIEGGGGSKDEQDRAFMVGMFSLLDILFGAPLAEIIKQLSLPDDVMAALLDRGGRLGVLLDLTERATSGNTCPSHAQLSACAVDPELYCASMVKACAWAIQISEVD